MKLSENDGEACLVALAQAANKLTSSWLQIGKDDSTMRAVRRYNRDDDGRQISCLLIIFSRASKQTNKRPLFGLVKRGCLASCAAAIGAFLKINWLHIIRSLHNIVATPVRAGSICRLDGCDRMVFVRRLGRSIDAWIDRPTVLSIHPLIRRSIDRAAGSC